MAFFEYLKFDGTVLPLPDSYDVSLSAVEADSSGETEGCGQTGCCEYLCFIFRDCQMVESTDCIFQTR